MTAIESGEPVDRADEVIDEAFHELRQALCDCLFSALVFENKVQRARDEWSARCCTMLLGARKRHLTGVNRTPLDADCIECVMAAWWASVWGDLQDEHKTIREEMDRAREDLWREHVIITNLSVDALRGIGFTGRMWWVQ